MLVYEHDIKFIVSQNTPLNKCISGWYLIHDYYIHTILLDPNLTFWRFQGIQENCCPSTLIVAFQIDRPFLVSIQDNNSRIMFIGSITNV